MLIKFPFLLRLHTTCSPVLVNGPRAVNFNTISYDWLNKIYGTSANEFVSIVCGARQSLEFASV